MSKREQKQEELYEAGMEILRVHIEEVMVRAVRGRSEGKGSFGYLEDDDIKRESRLGKFLQHLLWRMHLELIGETDKDGYCSKKCYDCTYKRYRFNSNLALGHHWNEDKEAWYCQAECECK